MKMALVIGASTGIGRAVAVELGRRKYGFCRVYLTKMGVFCTIAACIGRFWRD